MCSTRASSRTPATNATYADNGAGLSGFDPTTTPGYGETWAEWFEAPAGPHSFTDRGVMTVNSTFDGGISTYGDSDWIRIEFVKGTTYNIEMYSFSMETFLALADDTGMVLTNDDFEIVNYLGVDYAVSRLEVTATRTGTYYVIAEESGHNGIGAYTVSVIEDSTGPGTGSLKTWSLDEISNRLTDSGWEFFGGERRAWDKDTITYDASALTAEGRALVPHAFEAWAKVTGLKFVEVAGGGDITFDDEDPGKAYANSDVPSGSAITSANINIAKGWDTGIYTLDSYVFQTFVHEIGHTLGLAHAGDYNAGTGGPTTYPDSVLYLNDSWNTTIMSYINQTLNTNDKADYALVTGPMIADVLAVQDLYGVPDGINAGNTRYGKNSNIGDYMDIMFASLVEGTSHPLMSGDQPLSFTIVDSGGKDIIDLRTDTTAQRVDLRVESLSDIYGVAGAMVIARNTVIESYRAGSGNDDITGNSAKNKLYGNDGDDTLKGLKGNDKLFGDGGDDKLVGANGNDRLVGGAGNDELIGGKGKDTMIGAGGDDTMIGNSGADVFIYRSGHGRDTIMKFNDDKDTLRIDDKIWGGGLSKAQVLDRFGSDVVGNAVLDFGGAQKITIQDISISDLENDLVLF